MLPPYLKIWDWDWIFGRAVKAISSLGVRSPWPFLLNARKILNLNSLANSNSGILTEITIFFNWHLFFLSLNLVQNLIHQSYELHWEKDICSSFSVGFKNTQWGQIFQKYYFNSYTKWDFRNVIFYEKQKRSLVKSFIYQRNVKKS